MVNDPEDKRVRAEMRRRIESMRVPSSEQWIAALERELHTARAEVEQLRPWRELGVNVGKALALHGHDMADVMPAIEQLSKRLAGYKERYRTACREVASVHRENERLRGALGLFRCVIKSGEPWTDTCEREYRAALGGEAGHEAE